MTFCKPNLHLCYHFLKAYAIRKGHYHTTNPYRQTAFIMSNRGVLFVSLVESFGKTLRAQGAQVRIYFDAVFELVELGYFAYRGHVEMDETRFFSFRHVYISPI